MTAQGIQELVGGTETVMLNITTLFMAINWNTISDGVGLLMPLSVMAYNGVKVYSWWEKRRKEKKAQKREEESGQ